MEAEKQQITVVSSGKWREVGVCVGVGVGVGGWVGEFGGEWIQKDEKSINSCQSNYQPIHVHHRRKGYWTGCFNVLIW